MSIEGAGGIPQGEDRTSDHGAAGLSGLAGERHYSPKQLTHWGLSEATIRRLFEHEPGVMRLGEPSRRIGRKLKRSYYTIRIPETVALRVHRRLTSGARGA